MTKLRLFLLALVVASVSACGSITGPEAANDGTYGSPYSSEGPLMNDGTYGSPG